MVTSLNVDYRNHAQDTDFRGVHNDSGDEVKEDVVAVCADIRVTKGHLQLIHGLQQKTFSFVLKVFKGGFLVVYKKRLKTFPFLKTDNLKNLNSHGTNPF